MSNQAQASLMIHGGANSGVLIPLSGRPVTMGRRPDNDVVLSDTTVSRRHALIMDGPKGFVVRDLSTTNGTYVNLNRIGDEEHVLTHGDRIRLADSEVILVFRQESPGTAKVDSVSPPASETWVTRFTDDEVSLGEDAVPPIFGKDSDLFRFLLSEQGIVVSREDIARRLWPELIEGGLADQVIDEAIARIRAHVEKDAEQPEHLISIGESGFLLV